MFSYRPQVFPIARLHGLTPTAATTLRWYYWLVLDPAYKTVRAFARVNPLEAPHESRE